MTAKKLQRGRTHSAVDPAAEVLPVDYASLLAEVKERVRSAHHLALKAVNKQLVGLYWDIGRMIVERQADEGWGQSVVEKLAGDLREEFPGIKGFSSQNLWYMRQFHLEYRANAKLQPLVGEIAWSHNLAIMSRCKDSLEREFYLRTIRKLGWSRNVLVHQIENQSYEKMLLGQTNFAKALTPALRAQAALAIKDEYTFDFLELGEAHSERELERALIARIEEFLGDAGKPIGVATYQIVKRLPRELKGQLPSPEQIARLLEDGGDDEKKSR